jgi:hypothetical protein
MGRKSRAKAVRRAERARSLLTDVSTWAPRLDARAEPEAARSIGWLNPAEASSLPIPRTGVVVRASPLPGATPSASATKASAVQTGQAVVDPVRRLVRLAAQRHAIERTLHEEVRRLRYEGISWTDIGRALNITRQGARQRYSASADG